MFEYDVFVSHASADKENYVQELQESFKKLGIKIFYGVMVTLMAFLAGISLSIMANQLD